MEMWRKVTVAGLQETYLNLNNISQMSWNGVNTAVTLVNGKELHLNEKAEGYFQTPASHGRAD
jgi:uncharacterized protein YlzI (FlbEa/FlbD family)